MIAEDREYVERAVAGEKAAFDRLVEKHNRTAGAIAYAITGDFSSAEDVVQEAFLKAYHNLSRLREPEKFKLWLAGIVRSQAIDCLRRRKSSWALPFSQVFPENQEEESRGVPVDPAPALEELQWRRELREKVLEAVRSLSEEDRVVVVLKHMEGLSYREIAELTGFSEGAVESRLFRARQALRKRLDATVR